MTLEVSLLQHPRQRALFECWRRAAPRLEALGEPRSKRPRCHDERQTEAAEQHVLDRIHDHDTRARVHRLERRRWCPVQADFGGRVVLDDGRAGSCGPREEVEAPVERQAAPGALLPGGGHAHHRRGRRQQFGAQASAVDRDRDEARAGTLEGGADARVRRVLDHGRATKCRRDQQLGQGRERRAASSRDDHVVGGAADAASRADPRGDQRTQSGVSGRVGLARSATPPRELAPGRSQRGLPIRGGRRVRREGAGPEVDHVGALGGYPPLRR